MSIAELVSGLQAVDRPLHLFVDALDEAPTAEEALQVCDDILELAALPKIRVVVGTRREIGTHQSITERLGVDDRAHLVVDLDDGTYRDDSAVQGFAHSALLQEDSDLPGPAGAAWITYRLEPEMAELLAQAIARMADGNFLVAALSATALSGATEVTDPRSSSFDARSLPTSVGEALSKYLDSLGHKAKPQATTLLTALALAKGNGISIAQWQRFSAALGVPISEEGLESFSKSRASNYLIASSGESGEQRIQLFHQALADELARTASTRARTMVFRSILQNVAVAGGWVEADDYARTFAIEHAPGDGAIDDLLETEGFIVAADPVRLVEAVDARIHSLSSPLARLVENEGSRLVQMNEVSRRLLLSGAAMHAGLAAFSASCLPLGAPVTPRWGTPLDLDHVKLIGHVAGVTAVHIDETSAGQEVVVTGGADRTVRVWDQYGKQLGLVVLPGMVLGLARGETPGSVLACGDKFVAALDIGGCETTWLVEGRFGARAVAVMGDQSAYAISTRAGIKTISRAGEVLESWSVGKSVSSFNARANLVIVARNRRAQFAKWSRTDPIQTVSFSNFAKTIAVAPALGSMLVVVGSYNGAVSLIKVEENNELQRHAHKLSGSVRAISIGELRGSPAIAVGGSAREVTIFDEQGTRISRPLRGHSDSISALAIGRVGRRSAVVSGSLDGTGRIWRGATEVLRRGGAGAQIQSVSAGTGVDARPIFVAGDANGVVHQWDEHGQHIRSRSLHKGPVRGLALGNMSDRLLIASISGSQLNICKADTGEFVVNYSFSASKLLSVALHDAAGVVVVGAKDGSLHMWDLPTGTPSTIADAHQRDASSVAALDYNGTPGFASGGRDGRVVVWDSTGHALVTLRNRGGAVRKLAVLATGDTTHLAAGGYSATTLWRSERWDQPRMVSAATGAVRGLAVVSLGDDVGVITSGSAAGLQVNNIEQQIIHALPTAESVSSLAQVKGLLFAASGPAVMAFEVHPGIREDLWSPERSIDLAIGAASPRPYTSVGNIRALAREMLNKRAFNEVSRLAAVLPDSSIDLSLMTDAAFGIGDYATLRGLLPRLSEPRHSDSAQILGRLLGSAALCHEVVLAGAALQLADTGVTVWSALIGMHSMFSTSGEREWLAQRELVRLTMLRQHGFDRVMPDLVVNAASRILPIAREIAKNADLNAFALSRDRMMRELTLLAPDAFERVCSALDSGDEYWARLRPYQLISLAEVRQSLDPGWDSSTVMSKFVACADFVPDPVRRRTEAWRRFSKFAEQWASRERD
ncbi:WD40 repeat domain-containing protein [Agrococcus sp. Ld7]|uniref:WD40 repeat domain-containing protein n=1 Tax=Agrococcus sp. Ld7 TaxID=649148 RepID=UPI003863396C